MHNFKTVQEDLSSGHYYLPICFIISLNWMFPSIACNVQHSLITFAYFVADLTYLGSNDSFDFYVTFHDLFNHSLLVIFRMTILHTKTLLWCWGSLIHSDFWVQRSASFWGLTVSRLTFSQTSIQALKKEIQGYAKFKCKLEIIRL